mmetsp:Transcript_86663/g.248621  ORF Transcript_86663/g.248621 Transcript_86663/m.248621 type:complete len:305 (-) Transcript_86663:366-1280(-)
MTRTVRRDRRKLKGPVPPAAANSIQSDATMKTSSANHVLRYLPMMYLNSSCTLPSLRVHPVTADIPMSRVQKMRVVHSMKARNKFAGKLKAPIGMVIMSYTTNVRLARSQHIRFEECGWMINQSLLWFVKKTLSSSSSLMPSLLRTTPEFFFSSFFSRTLAFMLCLEASNSSCDAINTSTTLKRTFFFFDSSLSSLPTSSSVLETTFVIPRFTKLPRPSETGAKWSTGNGCQGCGACNAEPDGTQHTNCCQEPVGMLPFSLLFRLSRRSPSPSSSSVFRRLSVALALFWPAPAPLAGLWPPLVA